jgi:hypothetical protein
LKKLKDTNNKKATEGWWVVVEAVGTPGQQEKALKQATRYVLSRLAGRKSPPPSGKIGC